MSMNYQDCEYEKNLKFHCPENHKLTQLDGCSTYCKKKNNCDIYATMLDEIYKKDLG